ncbi:MAG: hypothetical protein AB7U85_03630 [Alphaproteobacteria bacterium]
MKLFNNPELRRNLWLEFNKRRVIAMPLGLLAVFLVAYLQNNNDIDYKISWVGLVMYGILTFLWGTRQSSETIIREVNLGTWAQQKMSNINPWQMVWGKLVGSTAFVWYGNIFCFLFLGYTLRDKVPAKFFWYYLGLLITFGVLAQSVSMLISLYSMRYRNSFEKFEIMFFQVVGIASAIPMLSEDLWGGLFGFDRVGNEFFQDGRLLWYGNLYLVAPFVLTLTLFAIFWVLIGIYFSMKSEFLIDNNPIVWFLFVLSLVLVISGFDKPMSIFSSYNDRFPMPIGYAIAFNVVLTIMYIIACGESKDALRLHLLKYFIASKQWGRFLAILPRTIVTLPVVIFVAALAVYNVRLPSGRAEELMIVVPYCIFAAVFFMIRDVGIIYLFAIKNKGKNSDTLSPILFILASYTLLPVFFVKNDFDFMAGLFFPWPQDMIWVTVLLPFIQAFIVIGQVVHEWVIKKQDWGIKSKA